MADKFSGLGGKVLLGCSGAMGLIIITIAASLMILQHRIGDLEYTINTKLANERDVTAITVMFKKQVQEWKDTLLRGRDPEALNKYWTAFRDKENSVQEQGRALLDKIDNSDAAALLREFLDAHRTMGTAYRNGLESFKAANFEPSAGDRAVKGIDRVPTQTLEKASKLIAGDAANFSEAAIKDADRTLFIAVIALSAVIVFITMACIWTANRYLVQPMVHLAHGLNRMADGDFSQPISVTATDELGKLASSAQGVQKNVGSLIHQIGSLCDHLATEATTMKEIASKAREAIKYQQTETDMLATAINEMSATVRDIASNTHHAADAAQNTDAEARKGHVIVSDASNAISMLAAKVEDAMSVIQQLEKSSHDINSVLAVIKGVADQTNLLALNAAIEAARAGEAGRGFAVVADEVRTLAQRTQVSTEEIQTIIGSLVHGVSEAVAAMQDSRTHAQSAVEKATIAGQSLGTITKSTDHIMDMNTRIASAIEEESKVTNEMDRNIVNVSKIAGDAAEAAELTERAGGNVAQLTDALKELTGKFRVRSAA